tara:strand:+ start:2490 stop:2705 length:216 start_codon:yes stop_codon:yes gene_type:complete
LINKEQFLTTQRRIEQRAKLQNKMMVNNMFFGLAILLILSVMFEILFANKVEGAIPKFDPTTVVTLIKERK